MQIIALGGSAMWGWMVPDSLTIPSLLQKNLNERLGRGSCSVRNYAENGYVSTQDLIRLILSLQRGERPSMVIMYDGFNDVLAACENAAAGTVIGQSGIEARWASTPVSTGPSSLLNFLGGLRTVAVIRELIPNRNSAEEGPEVLARPCTRPITRLWRPCPNPWASGSSSCCNLICTVASSP
jgi:lysophospholipase L1-like esterase